MDGIDKKPEIYFTGFTDAWEQRQLGDVSEIMSGGTPSTQIENYWVPKEIPWLSSGEVHKKRITYTDNMISRLGLENSSARWIRQNSVLIALAGQGKTRGTVAINCIPLTTNQSIAAIIINKELDHEFVFQNLENRYDELRTLSSADGSRGGLNKQILSDLHICTPKLEEQQKIGQFFQELDNLITLHQRMLSKIKNLKQAMLEKMFPKNGSNVPEIRFAGFTDAWEQRKLTDEVELYSGLTYSPNDVIKESGTLVLRSSNIKNGEIVSADNVYVQPSVVNSANVKVGDIIIVVRNGSRTLIGKHAQVKAKMDNTVIGAFMTGMRSSNSAFTNVLLSTPVFDSEVEKNLGATINQITNGMFQNMQFMFPSTAEQMIIGHYFTHLDNLITLHQRKYEKLNNLKKACLEKMFV